MLPAEPQLRYSRFFLVAFSLMTFLTFSSCGSDDEPGTFDYPLEGSVYAMSDLAGTWNATIATFEDQDDETNILDIIAEGGSATLIIQSDGRFTFSFTLPGEGTSQFAGQTGFSGNALVILVDGDEPGEDEAFLAVNVIDEVLYIAGPVEFDVDGDSTDEIAFMDLALESV